MTLFEKVRNGEWLRARVAVVESGIESSFKELHDRLALDKATARYVKESDEETGWKKKWKFPMGIQIEMMRMLRKGK